MPDNFPKPLPRPAPPAPPTSQDRPKRIVLGISGASGADYALRFLDIALVAGYEVHLVISDYGKRLLFDETDIKRYDLANLSPALAASDRADEYESNLIIHPNKDVGAVIASGSFLHDGMAVLPCSSTSLGAIATSAGSNLLTRAAMVTLKENRPLVVCHREMPVSLVDIENMRTLALAGATICPTNPGFYLRPQSVQDIIDFIAGKVADLLGVPHTLSTRWANALPDATPTMDA
ncbi:MAG: UbiX family flavin prenyltransferase [Planctomycetota bacterium]